MWIVLSLWTLLLQTTTPVIYVTVVDGDRRPVVGQRVYFDDETRQLTGHCVTSEAGTFEIQVAGLEGAGFVAADPAPLIRGQLVLPSNGVRPIIWPASEDVAITLMLNTEGKIEIPTHGDHAHGHDHVVEPTTTAIPLPTLTTAPTPTVVSKEPADVVSTEFTETSTPTTDAVSAERPLWPMLLCSGIFILLWGGVVVFLYRRQT